MAFDQALTTGTNGSGTAGDLAARWDAAAAAARNSPLREMDVGCLARYSGVRPWTRRAGAGKETLELYVSMGFGELLDLSGLSPRQIEHLLEIVESSLEFDHQCEAILSEREIEQAALRQRMRVVSELGLFLDYPVTLSALDHFSREYCRQNGLDTLDSLILFISREPALSGSLKALQGMLAHGDTRGLATILPSRIGWWGFHLPEALRLCLERLTAIERRAVDNYYDAQTAPAGPRRLAMPPVMQRSLVREAVECVVYFGHKQPALIDRIYRRDFGYLNRRLMHLDDPRLEGQLLWLVKLARNVIDRSLECARDPALDLPCIRLDRELLDGFLRAVENSAAVV